VKGASAQFSWLRSAVESSQIPFQPSPGGLYERGWECVLLPSVSFPFLVVNSLGETLQRVRGGEEGVSFGGCGASAYVGEVQCPGEAIEGASGTEGLGYDGEDC
jgi:hypothetical protein